MIKHIWTVVCREGMIDETTNNISVLDAYENLQFDITATSGDYTPGASITVPFNFEVISLFFRDTKGKAEEVEETLDILDPKGQKLGEVVSTVKFQEAHDRMRNIMKFEMMALTTSGTYLFQAFTRKADTNRKVTAAAIPVNIQVSVNGQAI